MKPCFPDAVETSPNNRHTQKHKKEKYFTIDSELNKPKKQFPRKKTLKFFKLNIIFTNLTIWFMIGENKTLEHANKYNYPTLA